jgi:parvulin-like peptidyl-prolyl isomerase
MDDVKKSIENEKITEKEEVKKGSFFKYFTIVLVIALLVVFGFSFFGDGLFSREEVAAKVNGDKITIEDVDLLYATLSQQQEVTKSDVLQGLIQSKVIYQEAEKQGFSISKEDAMLDFDSRLLSAGLTKEQFFQGLSLQGITEEEFVEDYVVQLTVQSFIDENVLNSVEISQKEIEDYYIDNVIQFEHGETVTVRHILIGDENLSVEEKENVAVGLLDEVNENNFCDYVTKHSVDVASVSNCGEYTFEVGDSLVQGFKDLSFSQEVGEIGTVNTEFGTHIIWTFAKSEQGIIDFSEATEQIEELLKAQKVRAVFEDYYQELADGENIKIYFEEI